MDALSECGVSSLLACFTVLSPRQALQGGDRIQCIAQRQTPTPELSWEPSPGSCSQRPETKVTSGDAETEFPARDARSLLVHLTVPLGLRHLPSDMPYKAGAAISVTERRFCCLSVSPGFYSSASSPTLRYCFIIDSFCLDGFLGLLVSVHMSSAGHLFWPQTCVFEGPWVPGTQASWVSGMDWDVMVRR